MQRVAAGDGAALAALMQAHWESLVGYAGRLLRRQPDGAQDVAQETFVRLWESRADWRPTGPVRAYLFRIARNLALNQRRHLRVHEAARPYLVADDDDEPAATARMESMELSAAVADAVAQLPERRRQIFCLARFHHMSYGEIATIMDLSPQTVANQMSSALADLRRLLAPLLTSTH
jgi:RNA polymerase sigma-70 factor (ECF subfamily)